MNAFERHGITHLSPSSLNSYATQPALWVMERLLGKKTPTSAAAKRGDAAEQGINVGLQDPAADVQTCIDMALKVYDTAMAFSADPKRQAERDNIPGYVTHGLAELRKYGVPDAYQHKIEVSLDGVPVPLIGYLDWRFDRHGLIVDAKTSEKLPGAISTAHGRQGALYQHAHGNYGMRFAYIKPVEGKKDGRAVTVYELGADEARDHLAALANIAQRLERFLALSADPQELAALLVPDMDHYFWSNPTTRAMGRETFGI